MQPIRRNALPSLLAAAVLTALVPAPDAAAQTLTQEHLSSFDYRSIGPTRQSGRFVDIAVPSDRPWTHYLATGSGHLWKTENAGITYEVLFENQDVFSIGDIAIAPSDSDIMYLGSGEANNSRSTYWGDGVYKSLDAGETWTNIGLPESHHIGRILVHPTDPDIVYVAALGHLYSENPERGLYKTTDGGDTWEQVLAPEVRGKVIGVVDVAMHPDRPDVLFAATYDKVRLPFTFDLGGPGSRVWKSTDAGETWTMLENDLPQGMLGRIGIDIWHQDPDVVALTIENANKEGMSDEERYEELQQHLSSSGMIGGEVYLSEDGGDSWDKISPDTMSIGGAPAYYYGQIRIDPNDKDVIHVLSAASWGTYDGGETWERRPFGFGGDDHALWIDPEDSDHIILGYDHGMGISYDGGENWYHPDFQSLAQFYAIGYDMSYPYRVAGGLQDNGSQMGPHTNPTGDPIYFEQWERVGGGDGMYNEFDTCNNRYLYNESQFGPISRLDLWTGERRGIRYQPATEEEEANTRYNWNAPILVSPHDCDVIFHGANYLLRSEYRGESWEKISPDLTKADPATLPTGKGGDGNIQYATLTTIAQSPILENVIWVGSDDGNVQVTRDGGESWTLVNDRMPGNPEYWVSRVEASSHQPGRAYVSQTGYRRDDFRPLLWRTDDYGETWTDITANLPEEPINVVREHPDNPDLLFVGTEFAVYVSVDRGTSWTKMKNDMPVNPVHDMKIHPRENDLIVATHGRGAYIAEIGALSQVTPAVLEQEAYFFQPEERVDWLRDDRTNYAFNNFEGESEPLAVPLFYHLRAPVSGDVTFRVYEGEHMINEITGPGDAGIHEVLWEMDVRMERSEEEMERFRERAERFGMDVTEEEIRYASEPAGTGTYTVVMSVGGREVATREVEILPDEWWMLQR